MDMNLGVQDENGMTAIMYAVRQPSLLKISKKIIYLMNDDYLNIADKQGNTVLFHSVHSPTIELYNILKYKIDINHLNKDNDSILSYCYRNQIYNICNVFSTKDFIHFETLNNEGKNAVIYLIEQNRWSELKNISIYIKLNNFNFKSEAVVRCFSNFFKKMYETGLTKDPITMRRPHPNYIIPYLKTLRNLIHSTYDFNQPIDNVGNTPLMFFIETQDYGSMYYLIKHWKNLDLSITNKHGESACSLCLKTKNIYMIRYFMKQPTFNYDIKDRYGNNLLMYFTNYYYPDVIRPIISKNSKLLEQTNDKKETVLIIATQLLRHDIVKILLNLNANVNHQDYLGNTALHYAVDLKDEKMINILSFFKSDIYIKNKHGESVMNIITKQNEEKIISIIENPIKPYEFQQKEGKSNDNHQMNKNNKKGINNNVDNLDFEIDELSLKNNHLKIMNEIVFGDHENTYQPFIDTNMLYLIENDIFIEKNKKMYGEKRNEDREFYDIIGSKGDISANYMKVITKILIGIAFGGISF
ncbi:ankyrin [Anaeromyces robustus]|uniref:Ankyrin n=1 Tax=Anaeromyces robustus TaxID=1754192 RepID=A0A1Y1XJ78_9FUNG|nr:ankyrin [Anaeromyces robustus]|eukprot:ORX85807.1 ankyrin [Anaeromyces robustus]